MTQSSDSRGLVLALVTYVLIFALKLGAYVITGVMALLAEALHTLSDIFVSGFLLVALVWSRRKADEVHMFGYGRAQNVAALVAATLFISFTSYKLFEESIPRLFRTEEAAYGNLWLALSVIVVSMIVAAAPMTTLLLQKPRGASANAQLMELINDQLGLLAALIGTLLIWWGFPIGDPIAAMMVATIIALNAVGLFRENLSFLLGRSPGPEFVARVEQAARSVEGVLDVRELRAEYVGPDIVHAGLHLVLPPGLPVKEAHRIAETVRDRVHKETEGHYCVIQIEPAAVAE
jgi:cation diffusion facilitator family transporter